MILSLDIKFGACSDSSCMIFKIWAYSINYAQNKNIMNYLQIRKCLCHSPCDTVSTLTSEISEKNNLLKICMPHPYNRSFLIISLIMHDDDLIFVPKFQDSYTLSS